MRSAPATEFASGFSHSTCLPPSSEPIAMSTWLSPGVQMSTTWMSGSATASRQSVSTFGMPNASANACVCSRLRPITVVTRAGVPKNFAACAQPAVWMRPMKA